MRKGQIGIVLMLVIGVIGLVIVNDIGATITTPTTATNETFTTVYNGTTSTLDNSCLSAAPTSVYDLSNGTAITSDNYTIAPGTYPNRQANVITWAPANFLHNDTTIEVTYGYGCNYSDSAILRLIVGNIPILFAVGLLVIAVGWAALR